jgi:hypothetical protein
VAWPGSAGAVGKMNPTCGIHASVRGEREGADDGRRQSKKKTYFAKYAKAGAGWPAGPSGLAVWAGKSWFRSAGRGRGSGRSAGPRRVAGPNVKKKDF